MYPAVVRSNGEEEIVDIYDPKGKNLLMSMPYQLYLLVHDMFNKGYILTEDQVIRPNAVINYLEASNLILLET